MCNICTVTPFAQVPGISKHCSGESWNFPPSYALPLCSCTLYSFTSAALYSFTLMYITPLYYSYKLLFYSCSTLLCTFITSYPLYPYVNYSSNTSLFKSYINYSFSSLHYSYKVLFYSCCTLLLKSYINYSFSSLHYSYKLLF